MGSQRGRWDHTREAEGGGKETPQSATSRQEQGRCGPGHKESHPERLFKNTQVQLRLNYEVKNTKQDTVPLLDEDSRFYSPPALINTPLCCNLF